MSDEEPIVGATYTRTYIYHNNDHQIREYTDEVCVRARVDSVTWKFWVRRAPLFERRDWTGTENEYTYLIHRNEFPVLARGDNIANSEPSFIHLIIYKLKDHGKH